LVFEAMTGLSTITDGNWTFLFHDPPCRNLTPPPTSRSLGMIDSLYFACISRIILKSIPKGILRYIPLKIPRKVPELLQRAGLRIIPATFPRTVPGMRQGSVRMLPQKLIRKPSSPLDVVNVLVEVFAVWEGDGALRAAPLATRAEHHAFTGIGDGDGPLALFGIYSLRAEIQTDFALLAGFSIGKLQASFALLSFLPPFHVFIPFLINKNNLTILC